MQVEASGDSTPRRAKGSAMFKIGVLSRLAAVPVKTLRYYDSIGLFAPSTVDRFTGYRYYTFDQLPRLNRILALRDLGFTLEQIGQLMDEDLSVEQMRGMLRMKQAEVEQQLTDEQARLRRIESRLRQIEQEGKMPEYEVVIKKQEPVRAATLRDIVPNYGSMGQLFGELMNTLGQHGIPPAGPLIGIYYDEEYKEQDVDAEVAVAVGEGDDLPAGGRVAVRELASYEMVASLMRPGPYDDFTPAYQALMGWIERNGYRITGPNREIYLRGPEADTAPDEYLTEILFPVEKV